MKVLSVALHAKLDLAEARINIDEVLIHENTLVPEVNNFAHPRDHMQHIVRSSIYQVSLAIFISNWSFLLNEQLCLGQS